MAKAKNKEAAAATDAEKDVLAQAQAQDQGKAKEVAAADAEKDTLTQTQVQGAVKAVDDKSDVSPIAGYRIKNNRGGNVAFCGNGINAHISGHGFIELSEARYVLLADAIESRPYLVVEVIENQEGE